MPYRNGNDGDNWGILKATASQAFHPGSQQVSLLMNPLQDIFISYGRADSYHFAKKLNDCLVAAGLAVWFDFDDIPLGVDYQKQIDDGIDKADNFVFIIAPHSVNSPYCALEVERALQQGKRIIPLLHIPEINYGTWLERNPEGTEEEWSAYQAAGKHSSFPNMHPAIQAINWVYFREADPAMGQEADDFERSLQGLLDICQRQQDYVHQHTVLLNNALEWNRHQKSTHYLLAGPRIQQAHDWLQVQFNDSQPPCVPTALHCEYITDSIKNAQNLRTQVFLGYADSNLEEMIHIRHFLQRQGLTVWSAHSDLCSGEECQTAIKRGIENADNVVVLLSPEFLSHTDHQAQIAYALELNKRIIPVWLASLTPSLTASPSQGISTKHLPSELQPLQAIDLTAAADPNQWRLDESDLLKQIYQDAAYVETHKILLARSIKWQRQHQNPCILLRGHTLSHAETWLKTAEKRDRLRPTELQQQFIQASLQQPPAQALDVFVSYSRTDADMARKLNDALQEQGKRTWFDQESIAPGADFQQEIYRGIEASDNILFVLSPTSINSPYCSDEVAYAASLNKRFVTVLYREIDASTLPPELAKVQWIDFSQATDFSPRFNQLVRTLNTDRVYVQAHTKWSQRAIAWNSQNRSEDLLLRGAELAIAEHWYEQSLNENKQPSLTVLQQDLIATSRQKADAEENLEQQRFHIMQRQLKATVVASAFAIGGLVAIAFSGWLSFRHGQKAVTSLATELSHQVSLHIQQNIETDMDRNFSFSRSVAIGARNGSLDINDMEGLRDYIWGYFQLSGGAVSKIYAGTETGEFVSLATHDDQVMMSMVSEASNFQRMSYDVDASGNFTTLISTQDYDPRVRPWYKAAMEGVTASPVYQFKSPLGGEELGISLTEAVKDEAGVLQGVASVDLSLTQLQNVLENLQLETRSHIFILEPSGYLLASSMDTPLFLPDEETSMRVNALDSDSKVIQQTTQQLIEAFGSLEQIEAPQALTFAIDDDRLIARVDTLGAELGVNWLIVTLIPESEVMKEIHANARMTAILLCSAIVMACILGVYVYRTISLSSQFEAQSSTVKRNLNTTLFLVNSFVQGSPQK